MQRVTNLFFYECRLFKAGAIIFNKKIVNCEICLHIVSIFCSTENIWAKGPLLTEYIKWRNVMYIFSFPSEF